MQFKCSGAASQEHASNSIPARRLALKTTILAGINTPSAEILEYSPNL